MTATGWPNRKTRMVALARTYSPIQYRRADRVVGEVGPDHQLVRERQGDRQIGVQVDPVPAARTTGAHEPRASS